MVLIALVLSICIAALGALGVIAPDRLAAVVRSFQTRAGLYVTAAIRLVLGVALFLAAPGTRAPGLIWGLGIFVFVAGLITPMVGLERFRKLTDWWLDLGPWFGRIWGAVVLVLGLLLAYAVAPAVAT